MIINQGYLFCSFFFFFALPLMKIEQLSWSDSSVIPTTGHLLEHDRCKVERLMHSVIILNVMVLLGGKHPITQASYTRNVTQDQNKRLSHPKVL